MIGLRNKDCFAEKIKTILLCLVVTIPISTYAWDYTSHDATTTHSAQLRVGAEFNKKRHNGLSVGISEELRFPM